MATAGESQGSLEEFRRLVERAGLDLQPDELEALKPIYELYRQHLEVLHSVDMEAEEVGLTFSSRLALGVVSGGASCLIQRR